MTLTNLEQLHRFMSWEQSLIDTDMIWYGTGMYTLAGHLAVVQATLAANGNFGEALAALETLPFGEATDTDVRDRVYDATQILAAAL